MMTLIKKFSEATGVAKAVLIATASAICILGFSTQAFSATGQITVVSTSGTKCLDVIGGSNVNGTGLQVWDCNGGAAQQWTYNAANKSLVNASGKCLDVPGATTANGTRLQIWDCNGGTAQQWTYTAPSGPLKNQNGSCLDDANDGGNGSPVQIWSCLGNQNQNWNVSAIAAPLPAPSCSSVAMQSSTTSAITGTLRTYAYGVQNATTVQFPTWGDTGGQDDIIWYNGINDGGGTWHADIDLSRHKTGNPEYGAFHTHVYVQNSSASVFCGASNWTRIAVSSKLTCNYPQLAIAPTTHYLWANEGNTTSAYVGFSSTFGGIATSLQLGDNLGTTSPNLLKSESSAGGAWQSFGSLASTSSGIINTNQSVGNTLGYQWGYDAGLVSISNGLTSSLWTPRYSDAYNGATFSGTSPCTPSTNPLLYDYDSETITHYGVPLGAYGTASAFTIKHSEFSLTNQTWNSPWWLPGGAFYFDRSLANSMNMQLFFVKVGTQSYDSVVPYDASLGSPTNTLPSSSANFVPNTSDTLYPYSYKGTYLINSNTYSYAVVTWQLSDGHRVGMAVPFIYGGQLRLQLAWPYCGDVNSSNVVAYSNNFACGAIDLYNYLPPGFQFNANFPANSVRDYSQNYYFGDITQLKKIVGLIN